MTHINQSKALASSGDYHDVIITSLPVNMLSRQLEGNKKYAGGRGAINRPHYGDIDPWDFFRGLSKR
jgi:hypothetical protein